MGFGLAGKDLAMANTSENDVMGESYVMNCYVQRREGDTSDFLMRFEGGRVVVKLDGYAIIPMEEYERLKARGDG